MKSNVTRGIAAVLALAATATCLSGIAGLAHVDRPTLPAVVLPAVTIVAEQPDQQLAARPAAGADQM